MFKNLTNFGYQRSVKDAIGFYIAYLVLIIMIGALFGGILGAATQIDNVGLGAGTIVAVIVSLTLSFLILKRKKSLGKFSFIALALLSGLLAIFLGGLAGLIPVAYLTTRPTNAQ